MFGDPGRKRAAWVLDRFLNGDDWWREVLRFYISLGTKHEEVEAWTASGVRAAERAAPEILQQQTPALRDFSRAMSPWLR